MERLIRAGLYATGLIPIRTSRVVARYNACLESAGLPATKLGRFRIDGLGWSPEIAEERGDPNYLAPGDGNQLIIVVTPDQHNRPVLHPFFTFEPWLMKSYFERFTSEIADLTSQEGIWLDVDTGISTYRSVADLLLIQDVKVRTYSTGGLAEAASEQQTLVRDFLRKDQAWADAELRRAIIASAAEHGDLRDRRLVVPEFTFTETMHFHTRAFGGVYVFRDSERHENLVVLEQQPPSAAVVDKSTLVLSLADPTLSEQLYEFGLLELGFESHRCDSAQLRRMCDALLAEAVWTCDPDVAFDKLTSVQRKGWIRRAGDKVPAAFFDLERLILRLEHPTPIQRFEFPPEVRRLLYEPAPHLPQTMRRVLWHLLCRINRVDVVRLYRHDPEYFAKCYRQWSTARKIWAINTLRRDRNK